MTEYQKRRDVLHEGLSSIPGVFLRKPEGAFYLMPRLPIDDCEDFASWMLTDFEHEGATVMMAPAPGFYATPGLGRDEVRIAYVLNCDDLRASVEVLGARARRLRASPRARRRVLARIIRASDFQGTPATGVSRATWVPDTRDTV